MAFHIRHILLAFFVISMLPYSFGKTYLHCFIISGKITDSSAKPVANEMLIFNPGKWNVDTVYTDQNGFYSYTIAYWPPCNRKASKKFWRTSQEIVVSGKVPFTTILYKPKYWLRPCEGRPRKPKTMTRNFVV